MLLELILVVALSNSADKPNWCEYRAGLATSVWEVFNSDTFMTPEYIVELFGRLNEAVKNSDSEFKEIESDVYFVYRKKHMWNEENLKDLEDHVYSLCMKGVMS